MAPLAEALGPAAGVRCAAADDFGPVRAEWTSRLAELIAASATPPLVIGWSMGGMLAFDALSRPAAPRAAGLVMISATLRFCAADHWPDGQSPSALRALRAGLRRDPSSALRGFLEACRRTESTDADLLDRAAAIALARGPEALMEGLDWLVETDLTSRHPPEGLPMMCVHGADDAIIPCGASRALASRFKIRLDILPGWGHSLPYSASDRVADVIRRGWKDI
jgi:pimeloyl-[acyl-carrier protein] methyl ester esterase